MPENSTIESNLAGLYKEVYGDNIIRLIPDFARITKKSKFQTKKKVGKSFHQPVELQDEQGFTYSTDGGSFKLNPSVSMEMRDASIKPAQIAVRYRIAMDAAERAIGGGARAFRSATELQYKNVMRSFGKRLELSLIYGSKPLIGEASAIAVTSATLTTLTIPQAEWSFMWAGMEGVALNFYDGAALVSSGDDAIFTLKSVDLRNRQLVIEGTATGSTALQAVSPAADLNGWFLNSKGQQMRGLHDVFTNTGELYGIDASEWAMWRTPQVDFNGDPLNFQNIIEAMVEPVGRGVTGKYCIYLSPRNWSKLANDAAALRRVDQSYKTTKIDMGTQSIEYYYQGGPISIESHLFVKDGHFFGMPEGTDVMKRIGSTEVTSANPKIKGATSAMFYMLPENMGFESRMYTDQSLFFQKPAHGIYGFGFSL